MAARDSLFQLMGRVWQVASMPGEAPVQPTAIVILKPCCLGDVVLATPAIAALKQRYPHAALDVAVGEWSRAALQNNPHVRQLLDSGAVGQGRYGLPDVWRLARRLRQHRYDMAVTLDRSPLVGLVPWLAGIPYRVGLDSYGRGFAHTVRVPVPFEPRHEARLYLDCALAGSVTRPGELSPVFRAEFHPTEADEAALPSFTGAPFVIIHPAGGANPGMQMLAKRWPVPRLAALARRFGGLGLQVALTGTAGDVPLCRDIASRLNTEPRPHILAGQLTLGQFGALCRRAALFVGGDTGAMHLAVAAGCKTVAIFGPSDPARYGPFASSDQAVALWRKIPLPPGGVGQGEVQNFSWENGVSVAEVWAECSRLLG